MPHRLVYFETSSLTGVCVADWPASPKDPSASATMQAFLFYVGSGDQTQIFMPAWPPLAFFF